MSTPKRPFYLAFSQTGLFQVYRESTDRWVGAVYQDEDELEEQGDSAPWRVCLTGPDGDGTIVPESETFDSAQGAAEALLEARDR